MGMELGLTGVPDFVIELYELCVCVCVWCPSTGDSELSKLSPYFRGCTSHVQATCSETSPSTIHFSQAYREGHAYEHV